MCEIDSNIWNYVFTSDIPHYGTRSSEQTVIPRFRLTKLKVNSVDITLYNKLRDSLFK